MLGSPKHVFHVNGVFIPFNVPPLYSKFEGLYMDKIFIRLMTYLQCLRNDA